MVSIIRVWVSIWACQVSVVNQYYSMASTTPECARSRKYWWRARTKCCWIGNLDVLILPRASVAVAAVADASPSPVALVGHDASSANCPHELVAVLYQPHLGH
mmetsp:Transcript_9683/g.21881  ORF Transcript_9683/g.21881 Transcript_9683/m.21881 type:complete len:103 (-) Transcript_9683:1719-2027(-)